MSTVLNTAIIRKQNHKPKLKRLQTQYRDQAYKTCIKKAILGLKNSDGAFSLTKASKLYDVLKTTFFNCPKGRQNQTQYYASKQLLSSEEKTVLKHTILQLQAWGWPARVSLLRQMASNLLQAKGQYTVLGVNWQQSFLDQHSDLQAKYSCTLNQSRFFAEETEIFQKWFDLYHDLKTRYGILDKNTYNMDKKSFMIGLAKRVKVIISKYKKQVFVSQSGN